MDNENPEAKIRARIFALKADLEKYMAEASAKIYGYQAAIGELEMLLKEESPQEIEVEVK